MDSASDEETKGARASGRIGRQRHACPRQTHRMGGLMDGRHNQSRKAIPKGIPLLGGNTSRKEFDSLGEDDVATRTGKV